MKFIDLFAGLGGFHLALTDLGHKCVFASEINEDLRMLYKTNHGIECHGDISQIDINSIPDHQILCAGFPCQPFSKAGKQNGLEDPDNGNFFNRIMEIAETHKTEYIFLENVPNLYSHDEGNTWKYIYAKLSAKYHVREQIISPHKYGIPQHRSRIYIVCRRKENGNMTHFKFPESTFKGKLSINSIIEKKPKEYTSIKATSKNHIAIWQEFLDNLESKDVPRFPIWTMEFGATYPYQKKAPIKQSVKYLKGFKGAFGGRV